MLASFPADTATMLRAALEAAGLARKFTVRAGPPGNLTGRMCWAQVGEVNPHAAINSTLATVDCAVFFSLPVRGRGSDMPDEVMTLLDPDGFMSAWQNVDLPDGWQSITGIVGSVEPAIESQQATFAVVAVNFTATVRSDG